MLFPKSTGGRAMAMEILIPNGAIRNLIREDKMHQIYSSMQAGQTDSGMITMNQSLAKLVANNSLTKQEALDTSFQPEELAKMLGIAFK